MEMGSSTTPSERLLQGSRTGGISFISTIIMVAAMAPVITKVKMVVPMILPARRRLRMVAMEPAMEENTIGTTMQNIMLMNSVPRGLRTVAPALTDPSSLLYLGEEPAHDGAQDHGPQHDGQKRVVAGHGFLGQFLTHILSPSKMVWGYLYGPKALHTGQILVRDLTLAHNIGGAGEIEAGNTGVVPLSVDDQLTAGHIYPDAVAGDLAL